MCKELRRDARGEISLPDRVGSSPTLRYALVVSCELDSLREILGTLPLGTKMPVAGRNLPV